ncbi:hypothetical protein WOLCODRAFT_149761 [Wolfiporia cocos MD-104 SS10]|uniref:Retrotransposon gag domain-containing protein n=1 Tax=Wolfiporia cocos (strain MD-104) TaxID=742152 RepID=A0A2H3JBU8_WOLCO|nr:hypothetical protein WOLCODRAFT_149761 [Wolfiporia cocos MD-104 SS10]
MVDDSGDRLKAQVLEEMVGLRKQLWKDYQDKLKALEQTFQEKLDDLEDALATWVEKYEDRLDALEARSSNTPATRTRDSQTAAVASATAAVAVPAAPSVQPPAPFANVKIPPSPKFSGSSGKVTAQEWVEKMGLYFGILRIYNDHERITQALFRVTGDAYKFLSPLIKKAGNGEPLGSWEEFTKSILAQHGKMMDKEIAKKEIHGYYGDKGKKLTEENYFNYCE